MNELKEIKGEDIERLGGDGTYIFHVLCFAADAPRGYIFVPVQIPNKKEFKRLKRQMFFVRMGLRKRLWYKNEDNEWQLINTIGDVILSVAPQSIESKIVATPDGEKKLYVASK